MSPSSTTTSEPNSTALRPAATQAPAGANVVLRPMVGSRAPSSARRSTIKPNREGGARASGHSRQPRSTTAKLQRLAVPRRPAASGQLRNATNAINATMPGGGGGGSRRPRRYLAANDEQPFDPFASDPSEPKAEVVAYCRNIQNPQVLRSAIKGFRGHQVTYFVIDSCKVPAFPNDLFQGIDVRWLEMTNSTVQFHNNFLHGHHHHQQHHSDTTSG